MKKLCLSIVFLTGLLIGISGQHLIGISKDKAEEIVRQEMRGFNLDRSSQNESFNYLKFINSPGTITLIIFFSKENKATSTRMVCDFSELEDITKEYNDKYRKTSKKSWEYTVDSEKFQILLEEKEWYFVVTTKKK